MDFLDGVGDVRVVVKRSVATLMHRSKNHLDVSAGERSVRDVKDSCIQCLFVFL